MPNVQVIEKLLNPRNTCSRKATLERKSPPVNVRRSKHRRETKFVKNYVSEKKSHKKNAQTNNTHTKKKTSETQISFIC